MADHDKEARLITAEYDHFYVICAYVPNSGRGLNRLEYRQQWNRDFLNYINRLNAMKPIIYGGDLNVAHREIGSFRGLH
jgi:exonuclease III